MNEDKNISDGGFPDELVSAYLDGELSPAEKLRVEEQLMDSAEHRQLFEELKALRQGMQSLPQRKLDADFASRVLERAEKQLLSEDAAATDHKPAAQATTSKAEDRAAWRGLIWSVSAMAAAVLLIVFSPWLTGDRNSGDGVALHQPSDNGKRNERNDGEPESSSAEEGNKPHRESLVKELDEQLQIAAKKNDAELSNTRERVEESESVNSPVAPAATGAGTETEVPPPGVHLDGPKSRDENNARPGQAGRIGAPRYNPNAADDFNRLAAQGVPKPELSRFQQFPHARANKDAYSLEGSNRAVTADQMATDMMVISMDVTPAALSEHFFEEMLRKHNIGTGQVQGELAQAKLKQQSGQLKIDEERFQNNKQVANEKSGSAANLSGGAADLELDNQADAKDVDARQLAELQKLERGREAQRRAIRKSQGDVDVMVVVATPSQIDGLLKDMRSQQQYVLAMASDRPLEAAKKSRVNFRDQGGFANGAPSFENEELKENRELKLLADEATAQPSQRNESNGIANFSPTEEESVVDAIADNGNADKAGERADRASEGGGQGAGFAGTEGQDVAKAEDAASGADAQLEEFRGIARRLHLPEDFQTNMLRNKRAKSEIAESDRQRRAPVVQSDAVEPNGSVQRGGVRVGGQQGQQEETHADGQGLGDAGPPQVVVVEGGNQQTLVSGVAAKNQQEPLVRVLFVLRATGQPTPTILATEPKPPVGVPTDSVPANAALREADEAEVAPPAADE